MTERLEYKKFLDTPFFTRVLIVILALAIVVVSLSSIRISTMGTGDYFVETVLPLPYWIGIAIIAVTAFFMLRYLDDKRYLVLLLVTSVVLIIAFRLAFPVIFTSIPAYEPDATNYMNVVNDWVRSGIDFGVSGNYQHDYPMAYLIAFVFIKFGISLNTFFRAAPFIIYAIDLLFVYLIIGEVLPGKKKFAAISVFLFSFSSLGYWVAVHWCPDLVGSMFFLLSLYLSVRFAKKGELSIKALAPVLVSIFILILSHHLSTLYFILTMFGLALSTWYFNPPQIKGKSLSFFVLGIFTYTMWFAYGTLLYPNFFNVYVYFSGGFSSATTLVQNAGLLNNITFVIYPAFIMGLFIIELARIFQWKNFNDVLNFRASLRAARTRESANTALIFSLGFTLVLALFFTGFVAGVSFPARVLETLSIGMFPLSSQSFLRITAGSNSKKKTFIIILILLIVVLTGVYRYYSQIQRRVIIG